MKRQPRFFSHVETRDILMDDADSCIEPPILVHTFFSPVGGPNQSAWRSIKSRLHAPVPAQSAFRFLLSWTTQQVSSLSPGGPILLHILLSICLLEDYDPSVLSIRVNEEPCPPRS